MTTLAVGAASLAVLLVGRRLAPAIPWTLLVLVLAIAVSAVLGLSSHGVFLAPLFEDLPQAALAAIVIVAVSGFWDVASLRRFAHIRLEAIVFAGLALAGVLVLGVLQGLVVTALLSLVYVVARISRPTVMPLVRDPADATWHRSDHRPDLAPPVGSIVVRTEAPLLYPNANDVKERVLRSRARPIHPPGSSCSTLR